MKVQSLNAASQTVSLTESVEMTVGKFAKSLRYQFADEKCDTYLIFLRKPRTKLFTPVNPFFYITFTCKLKLV